MSLDTTHWVTWEHFLMPTLDALITAETISDVLKWKFTYPLCKVVETNRDGILKILSDGLSERFASQRYSSLISDTEIKSFINGNRAEILIENEIERERQEKIRYWKKYQATVISWEYKNTLRLTQDELEKIAQQQLDLLWISTNANISTDHSFNSFGI